MLPQKSDANRLKLPLISILMPAKDADRFIGDCIQSIKQQTFCNWELIVIDDHSRDATAQIVLAHQQDDTRIKSFQNKDKGILPALGLALNKACGEYITRMDADDLMPDNKLEILYALLSDEPNRAVATGKVQYFSNQKISAGYQKYEKWLNKVIAQNSWFTEIYRECTIASPNWLMRRDEFIAVGGFEALRYPEDYDMVFLLREKGFKIVGSDSITHFWREHPDRASRNLEAYQQDAFFTLKLNHFLQNELKKDSTLILWGTARKGKLVAKKLLEKEIPFIWMDWQSHKYNNKLYDQTIQPLKNFPNYPNPLVINTVSPPEDLQKQIDEFLLQNKLVLGKNYFVF